MNNSVITIAKYTFIEGIKNRLFTLMLIGVMVVLGLAEFTGELAVTETKQIQGSITALILRIFAVLVISLFIISSIIREFNDKTIDVIIALPVPRYAYYLGKLFGFFILSVIIALLFSLPLLLYTNWLNIFFWYISLVCEMLIMTGLCLFFLFTLGNIITAFSAVIAFYLLSRSITTIQLISQSPIMESTALSQEFMNLLVESIAIILPNLDEFTRTEWLVYQTGTVSDLSPILVQTVIYILLLSAAALFDLYRRNF